MLTRPQDKAPSSQGLWFLSMVLRLFYEGLLVWKDSSCEAQKRIEMNENRNFIITFRNHPGLPPNASHLGLFRTAEWHARLLIYGACDEQFGLFSGLLHVGDSDHQVPSNYVNPPNTQLPEQGSPGSSGDWKIA